MATVPTEGQVSTTIHWPLKPSMNWRAGEPQEVREACDEYLAGTK